MYVFVDGYDHTLSYPNFVEFIWQQNTALGQVIW